MCNKDKNDLPADPANNDDSLPMRRSLYCDFVGGAVQHRLRFGGGRGQGLPKAAGLKPGINPHIIDATAGLGRDAFLLASFGATVTMIERSTEMHAFRANERHLSRLRARTAVHSRKQSTRGRARARARTTGS